MKILHLDIETAPNRVYSWGLFNQNIGINQIVEPGYTLCFAAKWHGVNRLMFHAGDDMAEAAWNLLDEADVVVHYNGTKFDIPTLNKEFLIKGLTPPSPYHQIDLLKTMRRVFRFTSNKLDYVTQALGMAGKVQHKGMELWHECMEGDAKAWKEMEKYNKQDVKLTEELYNRLLPWIENHPNHALYLNKPIKDFICPSCGGHDLRPRGYYTTKTQKYKRFRCEGCGTWTAERFTAVQPEDRKQILKGCRV